MIAESLQSHWSTPSERPEGRAFEQLQTELLAEHGVQARSYFVGDTDRPIHVIEAGSGDPLVFIHGGGGIAANWASLFGHLQHRWRCIAVDRPGHGLSFRVDYRKVPDYRAHAVEFVRRTLDALGLERATLVGNSMGGFFSLVFALAHPERVERLVLVGAPAGIDRWIPPQLRALATPLLGPLLWKTVARPRAQGMRAIHDTLLVADASRLSDAHYACGVAAHRLPGADVAWLSLLRSFVSQRGVRDRCYVRDELPRVTQPVLFVWGDRDAFAPPASGEEACRTMRQAELEVIAGAGHLPWMDEPEKCAEAIARHLPNASVGESRASAPVATPGR